MPTQNFPMPKIFSLPKKVSNRPPHGRLHCTVLNASPLRTSIHVHIFKNTATANCTKIVYLLYQLRTLMKRTSLNRISVSCGKLLNNPRAARRNRVCTYTRVAIILLVECVAQALVFDESRRVVDCVLLSQQRQLILNVFNSLSIRADVWM